MKKKLFSGASALHSHASRGNERKKRSKGKKRFTGIFLLFLVSVFQLTYVDAQEKNSETQAEKKGGETSGAAANTVKNETAADLAATQADKEKYEKEIASLRVQIETLEKENAALRAQTEESSKLQALIADLRSQIEAAKKAKEEIEKQTGESLLTVEVLEKDKADLQSQVSMSNKIKRVFERKASDLREEVDAAKLAQSIAEKKADEYREKTESLEKSSAAIQIQLEAATGESAELKTRLAEWRETLCPVLQSKWADGTIGEREDNFRKKHCLDPR